MSVVYIFGEAKVDAAHTQNGGKLPASENGVETKENAGKTGTDAVELV